MPPGKRNTDRSKTAVLLEPADPFELIRWLAHSQSDPKKAVAELIQNSLDADARVVRVERRRTRGEVTLSVWDDGGGVLPEQERQAALHHIAKNIGHSHKLGIDPMERQKQVIAGKYGIGLLGFWSIGARMELRSRVDGSPVFALVMERESPVANIQRMPLTLDAPGTFTEVRIAPVDDHSHVLAGRRLAVYLASELRGQLLARDVRLVVVDRMARGKVQREFVVEPRRFSGERLNVPPRLEVQGYAPLRVELYLARGADSPRVQVACAGTTVADDIADIAALGLAEAPWTGSSLSGLLDFPSFAVAPGTRRGVVPDRAAAAFAEAVERLTPLVDAELKRLDVERRLAKDRDVVKELRRALRDFKRRLPQYDLPTVRADATSGSSAGSQEPRAGPGEPDVSESAEPSEPALSPDAETPPEDEPESNASGAPPLLPFPSGPLASVVLFPQKVQLSPGAERSVEARALDAEERPVDVVWEWALEGAADVELRQDADSVPAAKSRVRVEASPAAKPRTGADLVARARSGDDSITASVPIRVVDSTRRDRSQLGIPEPHLVSAPDEAWRSRMQGERWEVNEEHPDYVALRNDARARVRYLLSLLAKEIVVRSSGRVDLGEPLEALVEILAHAERNLGRSSTTD